MIANNNTSLNSTEQRLLNEIIDNTEIALKYTQMIAYYASYQVHYQDEVNSYFQSMQIELVVSDEGEYFREFDSPEFNYPYEHRRMVLDSQLFNISTTNSSADYTYPLNLLKFMRTETCLEPSYMKQLEFVGEAAT